MIQQKAQEFALVTLVFPESSTINSAPSKHAVVPSNVSAELLPTSSSSFSTFSHDTTLAYSVPFAETADFLVAMREISAPETAAESQGSDKEGTREEKKWMMRASKNGSSPGGVRNWIEESWTSFVDLLKVRWSLIHTHSLSLRFS
jgi:hydroxymethylglutaryl-CoA reductase (NADPH)